MKNYSITINYYLLLLVLCISCVSTKSTIKNIDPNAKMPKVEGEAFVLNEMAKDQLYAYDPDYPVNVDFSGTESNNMRNITRFFNAIMLNGNPITFNKIEECCPFPTKNYKIGAGTLYIYEVKSSDGLIVKKIYMNIYEKGKVLIPVGFEAKK